ncbi:hypothetical protein [Numidum massiliense]|uniref:hypothetical protein n=1 Tax=Numidum massiliense TaxID=1522315 RepID=UPI0011C8C416|nr:hypothetical protein [Numidum massiliense]
MLLIDMWAGLLIVLCLLAHAIDRRREEFPQRAFRLWQHAYHAFMIVCLLSMTFVVISLQLLANY